MKIVLAFDSYKGCLSAREVCQTAAEAILAINLDTEVVQIPLSDGGEGLVESISQILPLQRVKFRAHDPLMNEIEASYGVTLDGKTAYMEMAATSGLTLVPESKRNPLLTTTYGVGDMIGDATRRGVQQILMGIGGSATCDGGEGMIRSLRDQGLTDLPQITVASDVTNPLLGPNGAAHVFGPQKGATPEQVELLEERMRQWAGDSELANHPGAGAAGGLGFGLLQYLHAEMKSGIDIILDIINFNQKIESADLVITGEGKSDSQTLMGKVPDGVLRRAHQQHIPVWLVSGAIQDASLQEHFDRVISINENDTRALSELIKPEVAKENLCGCIQRYLTTNFTN